MIKANRSPAPKKRTNFWTGAEDDLLRKYYNIDKKELRRLLPHRSVSAITTRARDLDLTKSRIIITARLDKRIRELAKICCSYLEIAAAIDLNAPAVWIHMKRYRIRVEKSRPLKLSGHPLYDEIRRKILEIGMTFRDLDRSLGHRQYYFSKPYYAHQLSIGVYHRAVKTLGGKLVIKWDDEHIE